MASPSEVARITSDAKTTERVAARAQQLRDAAQAEYNALVDRQQALVQGQVDGLKDLDAQATSADAVHASALAAHAETSATLASAGAEVDRIATARRSITASHIDDIRRLSGEIGGRSAQLVTDYWLERAMSEISSESSE